MSNDLSRQLCELCGIEYEKQEPVAATDGLVQAYAKTKLDFTKPENFVKLLEILSNYMYDDDRGISITENTVILGDPICLGTDESEKELNILQKVLKLLLDGLNEGFESDKKFKQSIREAEWVYED